MICKSCNSILTDSEQQLKYLEYDEYIELCTDCLRDAEIECYDFILTTELDNDELY
jgi:hypothetical protein